MVRPFAACDCRPHAWIRLPGYDTLGPGNQMLERATAPFRGAGRTDRRARLAAGAGEAVGARPKEQQNPTRQDHDRPEPEEPSLRPGRLGPHRAREGSEPPRLRDAAPGRTLPR